MLHAYKYLIAVYGWDSKMYKIDCNVVFTAGYE